MYCDGVDFWFILIVFLVEIKFRKKVMKENKDGMFDLFIN